MPNLRDSSHKAIFYEVPFRGIMQNVPAYMVPDNALLDGHNVLVRNGVLIPRGGLRVLGGGNLTNPGIGSFNYIDTSGNYTPLVATTTKFYKWTGSVWSDITGALTQTGTTSQLGRFTSMVLGTPETNYVFYCNGKDTPRIWTGSGNFAAASGSPPTFFDVTTIADRIVGLVAPYNVRWGSTRSVSSWPALNFKQAAETPDRGVAVRAFGQQGGVLYKTESLWAISVTGAQSEAQSFRFDLIGFYDGPASPAAVVDASGKHIYMTATGRVGMWDGRQHRWIADGLWPKVKDKIDGLTSRRIWGVYDPENDEVHFHFPLSTDASMKGLVTITMPRAEYGVQEYGAFYGEMLNAVSTGGAFRGATDRYTLMYTQDAATSIVFYLDPDLHNENVAGDVSYFACSWRTGLAKMPNLDPFRMEGVEMFGGRGNNYGKVTVTPYYSWLLSGDGQAGGSVSINLNKTQEPVTDIVGLDVRGRFLGVEFSAAATQYIQNLQYRGCGVYTTKVTP